MGLSNLRFKWNSWAETTEEKFNNDAPSIVAVDTETSGFAYYDEAFCVTIAWGDPAQTGYFELGDDQALASIRRILDRASTLVFHNAKFDLQKLILAGVVERDRLSAERLIDTECMAQLLDEHREKKLKTLARDLLGLSTNEAATIAKVKRKLKLTKLDGYDKLPRNVLIPYALKDADFTLRLFRHLWPLVQKDEQLARLFVSEMQLLLVMLDVEAAGMRIDLEYLERTTREVRTELLRHQASISKLTGLKVWFPEKSGQKTPEGCINVNAHQQILDALHRRRLKVSDTRNETLVGVDDPLPQAILALRSDKKLLDYLLAMDKERRGDIIHPNFKLFEPKTGRMSSGKVDE